MKMWPKTTEECVRSILFILVVCLLSFTVLSFASDLAAGYAWNHGHNNLTTATCDTLSRYMNKWSLITAGLLLLLSFPAAIGGYWKIVRWSLVCLGAWVAFMLILAPMFAQAREKPIIYLYPKTEQLVNVKLAYDGKLLHAYPDYPLDGWQIIAKPSGELINVQTGRSHYCLFWEGIDKHRYRSNEGFVVAGKDTACFLQSTLATLGLSDREANEFIIYWLPRMEKNAFNVIAFPSEEYSRHARLEVTPTPDTLIRVFMVFKPVSKPVVIKPPTLKPITRSGFTVVERGGTEHD